MLNMKCAVLLLLLLPAFSWAAEPGPAPGQETSASGSVPTRPSLSVPLAVSDARCDMAARFNAAYWYTATLCAQRHKELRPQAEKIKERFAATFPGFHRAITMAPYSAFGKAAMDKLPYGPDSNPFLTVPSCKDTFRNLTQTLDDAKTRQRIMQCWEQPHVAAKGVPSSPLDDKVCVGTAQYLASAWYKAGMCTDRHKDLAAREASIKARIATAYPEFQKTISMPPILDAGKYMATYALSKWGNDPSLSEAGCEENLVSLAAPLNDTDWKDAVLQCWGKPRAVAQEKSPAAR